MTIGERIKYIRYQMGLTQEDLASAAKTTKQTIHKYETGIITNIPAAKIKAIAEKLHTTPAYLMGWDDPLVVRESPSFSMDNNEQDEGADKVVVPVVADAQKAQELQLLVKAAQGLTLEQIKALKQLADNLKN